MTQIRVFKNADLDRLENEVNYWMQEQGDKITVLSVDGNVLNESGSNQKPVHTKTVLYSTKQESKILHG